MTLTLLSSMLQTVTFSYPTKSKCYFCPQARGSRPSLFHTPHPSGATPALFRASVLCADYARVPSGRGRRKPKSVRTQLRRDRLNPWVGLDHLGRPQAWPGGTWVWTWARVSDRAWDWNGNGDAEHNFLCSHWAYPVTFSYPSQSNSYF